MLSRDRIFLQGLQFFSYHGVLVQERELGQRFIVDLELVLDLRNAGKTDDISNTVNYAHVYDAVNEVMSGKRYKLIEAVAEDIAAKILELFPVEQVKVTVKKPHSPVPAVFDYVAVQVVRDKD